MRAILWYLSLLCCALVGAGCEPQVLRQDIPVSTNPLGAKILANGVFQGMTPGTVSLERNRDHIVTLLKENFRQEEVILTRQYLSDRVFMKAVQSGLSAGMFHKNAVMGMGSGFNSISSQEDSGEAYVLLPRAIKIDLIPLGTTSSSEGYDDAQSKAEPRRDAPEMSPAEMNLSAKDIAQAAVIAGAAVRASQVKPLEKNWDTSSSTRTSSRPDGTIVTETRKTSVGVGINPAGMLEALDVLFK